MTTATIAAYRPVAASLPPRPNRPARFIRETGLLVVRSLRMIPRVPERLSDVTLQPILFTVLFLYVFGSAIHIPGMKYQDYMLPGVLGQTLAFGLIGTGTATVSDFASGVTDRFRSLPVTRLSVICAQVIGQMLEQILGMTIVAGVGLALGWRPDLTLTSGLELGGLILLGLFTFAWAGVLLGMLFKTSDAVQGVGFATMLPLTFLGGTFVPIEGMKLIPRVIGEWSPVSTVVAAIRQLCQGTHSHGSWLLEHPVPGMVGWCVAIIAICVPMTLARYRKMASA